MTSFTTIDNTDHLFTLALHFSTSQIENIDDLLSQIFNNNRKLRSLKLVDFNNLTGKCFLSLNESSIEETVLHNIHDIQNDFLIKTLPNFKKLQTFAFAKVDIFIEGYTNKNLLKLVSSLKNLEELSICVKILDEPAIDQSIFDFLTTSSPNLKVLSLSDCEGISDSHIESLYKFKKLEVLKLYGLNEITGSGLENLASLKELHTPICHRLKDNHLISLLRFASNLQVIDLQNCDEITNSLVNAAIEETKKRKNNLLLEICIGGTSIDIEKIEETSSLLHLIYY